MEDANSEVSFENEWVDNGGEMAASNGKLHILNLTVDNSKGAGQNGAHVKSGVICDGRE
jgi:hypothetical protein